MSGAASYLCKVGCVEGVLPFNILPLPALSESVRERMTLSAVKSSVETPELSHEGRESS